MKFIYFFSFLIPLSLVLSIIPLVRRIAVSIGFFDIPAARKVHKNPVPLGGGVGVYLAFMVMAVLGLMFLGSENQYPAIGIIVGASLIVLIGVYDDYFDMDVLAKMLGQIIAAVIFLTFTQDVSPIMSFSAYPIFAVVWIVSLQNALNFLDNMDGLCGGLSLMIGVGFGVLFILKGMPLYAIMSFALAGGAAGFLRYNLPPASIFLGDAGSLLLGFSLSCLGIVHLNTSPTLADALAPVLIMAYPIFDLTFVVISRLNEGRKVYIGGKDHSSHKISFMGLTKERTVFLIYVINALLVISGVSIYYLIESPYRILVVTTFALALAFAGSHLYKNVLYLKERILAICADLLAFNLAFICYYLLKFNTSLLGYSAVMPLYTLAIPLIWINLFWLVIYSANGIYDLPIELGFRRVAGTILKSIVIGSVIFLVVNFDAQSGFTISLSAVAVYSGLLLVLNFISRFFIFKIIQVLTLKFKLFKSVIVNLDYDKLAEPDLEPFYRQYSVVGYLGKKADTALEYLGDSSDLIEILKDKKIARVILFLSEDNYDDIKYIFDQAYFMETRFIIENKRIANLAGLKIQATVISNHSLVSTRLLSIFMRFLRRLFNSTIAFLVLAAVSPVLIIKYFISLTNRVPFSARLELSGQFEKKIACHVFYDSYIGADRKPGPASLDLLSLVNVLRGDLGLVGGVPLSAEVVKSENERHRGFWRRSLIKPGIWGPAHFADKESYFDKELQYMKNMSIFSDIYWIIIGPLKNLLVPRKDKNAGSEVY